MRRTNLLLQHTHADHSPSPHSLCFSSREQHYVPPIAESAPVSGTSSSKHAGHGSGGSDGIEIALAGGHHTLAAADAADTERARSGSAARLAALARASAQQRAEAAATTKSS